MLKGVVEWKHFSLSYITWFEMSRGLKGHVSKRYIKRGILSESIICDKMHCTLGIKTYINVGTNFDGKNYLAICQSLDTVSFYEEVWSCFKDVINSVNDVIDTEESEDFQVGENIVVRLREDGVGFFQGEQSVILSRDEWGMLMILQEVIAHCILSTPKSKTRLSIPGAPKRKKAVSRLPRKKVKHLVEEEEKNEVPQYSWILYTNGIELKKSEEWFFNESRCTIQACKIMDLYTDELGAPTPDVKFETRYVPLPSPDYMFAAASAVVFKSELEKLVGERCEGCCIFHPSQTQHMYPGGHLSTLAEQMDVYGREAYENVDFSYIIRLLWKTYCELPVLTRPPFNKMDLTYENIESGLKELECDFVKLMTRLLPLTS